MAKLQSTVTCIRIQCDWAIHSAFSPTCRTADWLASSQCYLSCSF